jgi:hypothetical protein
MTTSGTKRTRKAESDKANKNKKLKADEINKEAAATAAAAAAVAAAAPVQVILGFQEKELQTKRAAAVASASLVVPPNNKQEDDDDDDDLGNPYEATSKLMMGVVAAKQQAPTPPIKIKSPSTPNKTALNGVGSTPFIVDHHSPSMMKRSNSRTSVPCILLFLVAFFLWCSVTLIGLLLSERLEHQLQMYQLRQVLQKREQVVTNNDDNNPKQDNINRWKEMVNKLEWQKKGMMKEFGEKLASLEFTME